VNRATRTAILAGRAISAAAPHLNGEELALIDDCRAGRFSISANKQKPGPG
jgi:hypothetical protein